MAEPLPGYLAYRVLDSDVGTELIPNLPHLHQAVWTPRALQAGMPGSATIGDFTIPLHPPRSDLGAANAAIYDLLDKGQRIEAFAGDVVTGTPRYSGVITSIDRPMNGPWVIHGSDTSWWLQQSQLFDGEQLGPAISPNALVNLFAATREVVYDQYATDLTKTFGAWANVAADPQFGLPAISSVSTTGDVATSSASWAAGAQYSWPTLPTQDYAASVTAWGTLTMGTDASLAGNIGILWLSDATGANAWLAEIKAVYLGSAAAGWRIDATVYGIITGSSFLQASTTGVFTVASSVFPYQFGVSLYSLNNVGHQISTFINGKAAVTATITDAQIASIGTPGKIGVRCILGAAGAPKTYVNRLRFESRTGQGTTWGTNRFVIGTSTASTAVVPFVKAQSQTHLDMMLLASSLDGFSIRVTPKRGYKSDVIDYGALGVDRSASIRFVEGDNLIDASITAVADLYSPTTRLNAIPGDTSGGAVTWGPIQAAGAMALVDSVSDLGAPSATLQLANAIVIGARKANPMQATRITVQRTADTADQFDLLDKVMVHCPTLRIYWTVAQVIGWTFTEGAAEMIIFLNQFPRAYMTQLPLQRLSRTVEWLANTSAVR